MPISSRTPEGDPNCCPVCGRDTRIEPSTVPTRDAPCPHCGSLMWFPNRNLPARFINNRLYEELMRLSKAELAPADFYGELLKRVLTALVAPAGAVWVKTPEGNLQLQYQINAAQVGTDKTEESCAEHSELLRQAIQQGRPMSLPPHASAGKADGGGAGPGNSTDFICLIAPILVDKQAVGLIEVWQSPNRHPDAVQGFLQFLVRMAGLASGFISK